MPLMWSCLDEQLPQTDGATADQVAKADKIGLVNGLTQYMNTPIADFNDNIVTGLGYPEQIIWHGVMTADQPVWNTNYNYWQAYNDCLYMGNYSWQYYYWTYYQYLVYKATLVIQNCDKENEEDALSLATGCAYRAYMMHDMLKMYEFKKTGTSLDATYYDKLKGLTVPIVNENTTEAMAKQNPRAPFYEMYRYIMHDLDMAEAAMDRTSESGSKNFASKGLVYGLKARLWLDIASRFERYPEDLSTQIAHDNEQYEELGEGYQDLPAIGVTNANEAFANAAEYARKAINCGYSVLTKEQWYDTSTGFNTANNSWIWAILISSSDKMVTYYEWESWASFMSPESSYGLASATYKCTFLIDANLFANIPDADWRKLTWIDPADDLPDNPTAAEEEAYTNAFEKKYADKTNLSFAEWSEFDPYVGFKFHPGSGNGSISTTGNKVDIPLMRVEEMYLIEAEALYHSQGPAAGKSALETFLNNYRYDDGSYVCTAVSQREFEREIVRQKSIEFWGEGVSLFDIKRLEMAITRGYDGTNWPASYQYNSLDGYVAPWTILYIPQTESRENQSLLLNPDPSVVMLELKP